MLGAMSRRMAVRGSSTSISTSICNARFGFRSSRRVEEERGSLPARIGDRGWWYNAGYATTGDGYKLRHPLGEVLAWVGVGLVTHGNSDP